MSDVAELPDHLIAEVRLASVRGVGPRLRQKLLDAFTSAERALHADPADLARVPGVGPKLAAAVASAPTAEAAREEMALAAAKGIRPLLAETTEYPSRLGELCDAPPLLYCRGRVAPGDARAIAIVGTRRASRYGLRYAAELAAGLARADVTVISGLARGVDGAAHRACLDAGGRTLAVLAGGLLRIYPPEHESLADEVAARGALLAESPPGMPPMSGSFPQRNRIISGVSLGVVVIEAAQRSGALITARHAAEQGRDVFALPGQIDNPQAAGCHQLIQEGAKLVTCVDDILGEIEALEACGAIPALAGSARSKPAPSASTPTAAPALEGAELAIWQAIGADTATIDQLVETTRMPAPKVLATISVLELAGRIDRVSGVSVRRR